jgi:hypothetical protein
MTTSNASYEPDCELKYHHAYEEIERRVGGGTTVCTKCGMDAMSYSLRYGD